MSVLTDQELADGGSGSKIRRPLAAINSYPLSTKHLPNVINTLTAHNWKQATIKLPIEAGWC